MSIKVKIVKITTLSSYRMLKEAEAVLMRPENANLDSNRRNQLACITLNNLGCLYKKLGFNKVAYKHFTLVLRLEHMLEAQTTSLVSTMLNICATLSNQNKHHEAL